ncbi:MAG: hypothetical protein RBU23_11270 [Candidatus Auribacterota bacterium]|jgi:tetratricopeptide (TPR) repeat protein|nr:hypothetical protein [Candidatus Auribacterota bacterium]
MDYTSKIIILFISITIGCLSGELLAFDNNEIGSMSEQTFLILEKSLKDYLDNQSSDQDTGNHRSAVEALISAYKMYIDKNPENIYARRQLIDMYILIHQYDEALEEWSEIISREPDNDSLLNDCGIFYSDHVYRPLEAAMFFKKAISINPHVADYHANLGLIYFVGRHVIAEQSGWTLPETFSQILKEYDTARRLDPKNYLHARDYAQNFVMADTFGVSFDPKQAIQAWKDCLSCDMTPRQFVYVYIQIARLSMLIEDKDQAKICLQKALEYDTNNETARQLLNQLYSN